MAAEALLEGGGLVSTLGYHCTNIGVCVCVNVYAYVYIHIYIYTYIQYIYMHKYSSIKKKQITIRPFRSYVIWVIWNIILLNHRGLELWNNCAFNSNVNIGTLTVGLGATPPGHHWADPPQGLKDQICHSPCRSGVEGGHKLRLRSDSQPAARLEDGEVVTATWLGKTVCHGLLTIKLGDLWKSSMPNATNIPGISPVFLLVG